MRCWIANPYAKSRSASTLLGTQWGGKARQEFPALFFSFTAVLDIRSLYSPVDQ
uniref:Uncharacterized protein n=1 Tax=Arundo donax TaxID=35708 RepID=A0A0A8YAK8_ARUDO